MKIVLAGAFGNLGAEILKALVADGHDVIAADLKEVPVAGLTGKYAFRFSQYGPSPCGRKDRGWKGRP